MKCKSCGGAYLTKELKCPYCGRENSLGKRWKLQRAKAEKEYEKARVETGRKISLYSVDKILNRVCLVLVICIILSVGFVFVYDKIIAIRNDVMKDKYEIIMQEYFESGDYKALDDFMDEKQIELTEYYTYTQATLLYNSYESYITYKCRFMEMSPEEKQKDDYCIQHALKKSVDVYLVECGIYSELATENQAQYDVYAEEIMSFWIGSLGLTKAEIEEMTDDSYLTEEEENRLTQKIRNQYIKESN